jgi:hypothetical protein
MKNLKKALEKAILERFKQHKIVEALEKELVIFAEETAEEKYAGTKIKRFKREYELYAVKVRCYYNEFSYQPNDVEFKLIYMTTSELTKEQKAQLNKCKKNYKKEKYLISLDEEKFGILWFVDSYKIKIDKVIRKEIWLEIEGKIS